MQLDAEELTPPLVTIDQELHFVQAGGKKADIVGETTRGQVAPRHFHSNPQGSGPVMEGLEEDVQEIGAGRSTLGEPIGRGPRGPLHLTVPKVVAKVGVLVLKAEVENRGDAGLLHDPEDGPPRE